MSLLDELVGAVAAVEAVKKMDPNAGLLEEGIAAYTGFKGVGAIEEHFANKKKAQADDGDDDQTDDDNA